MTFSAFPANGADPEGWKGALDQFKGVQQTENKESWEELRMSSGGREKLRSIKGKEGVDMGLQTTIENMKGAEACRRYLELEHVR